ncbi:Fc.00g065970.m01.CDS01 [Cosmosporella sp. VM-42]
MPLLRSSESRPSTSSDGHSISSSLGTKRRFPLLHRKKNRNSELIRPSTALPPSSKKQGFRVHVQIKFEKPLSSTANHSRDYDASPKFVASDRMCQALLSRLQHCSAELITRHDCRALDPLQKPHRDVKPLRYRITYRVERDGLCLVEKSLRSFQEYELTSDDAREVVAATDRIVGLFLLRHDPGFRWAEVAEPEPFNIESETVRPCTGRPQSTCCIPRSRFIGATQTFELIPGYSIELFLRSRCATRYPENRNASIKIDSLQPTPLTLLMGEDLTTRVFNLLNDPVDSWKRKFDKRHRSCDGLQGTNGCQHVEDGALDVMIKVRNNLGPDYNYFSHRIQTSKVLFTEAQGRDFDEFANQLKAKMEKARDMVDQSLRSTDDFTLKIRELRGNGWSVHEPLSFRLDPSVTYCRQTIEAIIERLQAGISNVLEGHEDALATMTAHKRGHLIYDGFLDGAGAEDDAPREKFETPDIERRALEQRLRDRIRADITMLCKDTCALDCSDLLPNLKIRGGDSRSSISSAPRPPSQISLSTASMLSDHTLNKKQAKPNLRDRATSQVSQASHVSQVSQVSQASQASSGPNDLARVPSGVEMAKRYGYMADYIADDENLSEPPSTPSLVDTDSISPRDSVVVTPQSSRHIPEDQSNQGLRIVDDGRRIIYQERSDADDIATGGTEIHHFVEDGDEILDVNKGRPINTPSEKPTRKSFDTRMPDLSGKSDYVPTEIKVESAIVTPQEEEKTTEPVVSLAEPMEEEIVTPRQEEKSVEVVIPPVETKEESLAITPQQEEKLVEPVETEPAHKDLPHEGVLEYICQPASPVESEGTPVTEPAQQTPITPIEALKSITSEPQAEVTPEIALEPIAFKNVEGVEQQIPTITEPFENSQDDTWELVEANNALHPVHTTLSEVPEVPEEVESTTKSETSMESNSTEPAVCEVEDVAKPAAVVPENDETPRAKPVLDDALVKEPVEQLPEPVQETKRTTIVEDGTKDVTPDAFPRPPSQKPSTEELPRMQPSDVEPQVEHLEDVEEPVSRKSEDSAIDLKELGAPIKTETEPSKSEDKPTGPASEDSGISMSEHPKSVVAPEVVEQSESKTEELEDPVAPKQTKVASPETAESYFETPAVYDTPIVLEAVPEVAEAETLAAVVDDASVVAAKDIETQRAVVPAEDSFVVSASDPTSKEATPATEDAVSTFPAYEEVRRGRTPTVPDIEIPQVIPRPRLGTRRERPNSTALLLDIGFESDPFEGQEDCSPIDGRSMSAVGPRQFFQHRRQPSAGLLGLREQRIMAIGLRQALVPYRFQALRRERLSESRPGTSYSEQ